ncbi:ATP synthase subunit C lysine N-methyltransferase isoform X1 [Mustela lutreola]|uniref:ATP synthase subunit C lysine N-methyltransferase isoform X1 n=2 Tax=Mustela lutreola TaxID=9666 RepID=UPI0027978A5D|nr:ATP synthase subunit C lysine N-methyltransferase isoform X1 [Mustela lutreola]
MEGGGGAPPAVLEENESRCVPAASCGADGSKRSSWGFLFTGIVGGTLVAVYAVATPFLTPALRKICLPFVPATTKQIENVVKMLHCRTGSLVDIGSGDGRIVIAAAKAGFRAVGYELNPWLVWYSRYRAWREGVQDSAQFYISDLWKTGACPTSHVPAEPIRRMVEQGRTCASGHRWLRPTTRPPTGPWTSHWNFGQMTPGYFLAVLEHHCFRSASDALAGWPRALRRKFQSELTPSMAAPAQSGDSGSTCGMRKSYPRESEHRQTEWKAESEGEADSPWSKEPDAGLDLRTLGS